MFKVKLLPLSILFVMAFLMLGSVWNDSATMDELAHIPAGFGYVAKFDYRLNPEHPPLIKSLAALSALIFTRPNFPVDTPYWQDDINGQWAQGTKFLYESGNDADKIIFWARMPMILLALFFGWMLFNFVRKRFNYMTAILTLIFYAFSPTFLAHSRLVTTDLGASIGFFIGIVSFVNFLEAPTKKNILLAGLAFGAAQLLKFSLFLLIPVYGILILVWVLVQNHLYFKHKFILFLKLVLKSASIGFIGVFLIWIVYAFHVWNYPLDRQYRDAEFILSSFGFRPIVDFNLWMITIPIFRSLGQYLIGILMVIQRAAGGNTAYFLGEVSTTGSRLYFPTLYLLKEPLSLHLLTIAAAWFVFLKIKRQNRGYSLFAVSYWKEKIIFWIKNNFFEFAAVFFIIFYWAYSMRSPLNIGLRHVLPTFPFIYILVAKGISNWLSSHKTAAPESWLSWLRDIYELYIKTIPRYFFVFLMVFWLIADTIIAFPNFIPYYNELAGGTRSGYKIAVDSNYDWGQDLKRLKNFVEERKISKIAIDYFGGGNPKYYLGERYLPWQSAKGPYHGWFAVSATFREGAFGEPKKGFTRKPEDSYEWLKSFTPVAQIGYSIFVYNLP